MKKLSFVSLFLVLIAQVSFSTVIPNPEGLPINYELKDDNTATVIAYSLGYSGDIAIPSEINYNGIDYIVNRIGEAAFQNCQSLTSITLPNTITNIENYGFRNCIQLVEVNLPESLMHLGEGVFYSCSALSQITLPSSLQEISWHSFNNCSSLISIEIPESVTWIGRNAFSNCTSLTNVKIPNSVTELGPGAFNNCSSLKSIEIPESVQRIFSDAFGQCSSLTDVKLPSGISSINNYTFSLCTSLTSIEIPSSVTSIGSQAFMGCISLKSIIIPNTVVEIGWGAFGSCTTLTKITLPESIENIECNTFSFCPSLKSITIPSSIKSINKDAFHDCRIDSVFISDTDSWCNIKFENYESNPLHNGGELILKDSALKELNISNNISQIHDYAFIGCRQLEKITIPNTIKSIGDSSFMLNTLVYFNSPKPSAISESSFSQQCIIIVPESSFQDYINAWPTYRKQICSDSYSKIEVNVNANAIESGLINEIIGDKPDDFALNIVDLKINGTINSYDIMVLRNKLINLRSLDMSDATIVSCNYEFLPGHSSQDSIISSRTFSNMTKIKHVVLPNSTKTIGDSAFINCTNLIDVIISDNVENIGYFAFYECTSLTDIKLPSKLNTINGYSFFDCKNLKSISIPDNSRIIDDCAFYNCSNLQFVDFPANIEVIRQGAFVGCTKLRYLQLPSTLREIGASAFSSCQSLSEVKIPSSVTYIGSEAFRDCNNIKKIYTWTIAPTNISQNTFDTETYRDATLYVPESSQKLYYFNTQWSQFLNVETFNEPYEYFYLDENDLVLSSDTPRIEGDNDKNPTAELYDAAAIVVEGDNPQNLGDVSIGQNSSLISLDSDNPNINIDRFVLNIDIIKDKWYFFCFPFDVPTANIMFNGQFHWGYYDGEYRAEYGSGAWRDANIEKLNANQGYIFAGSKNGTLSISVENVSISSEEKIIALQTYDSTSEENASWNLVGNPFTSYYNLADIGYTAPITIWNPETGTYEAWNPIDDDVLLYPYQAFFVQKTEEDEGVGFDAEYQETYLQSQDAGMQAAAQKRRMSRARHNEERYLINLELCDGQITDKARIVFNEKRSLEYERSCDAAKFISDEAPQIFTLDAKNVKYAINERPLADGVVRIGIVARSNGTYSISASRLDRPAYLIDLANGTCTDLSAETYEFELEQGQDFDRFLISTEPDLTRLIDSTSDEKNVDNYYNLQGIKLDPNQIHGIKISSSGVKSFDK